MISRSRSFCVANNFPILPKPVKHRDVSKMNLPVGRIDPQTLFQFSSCLLKLAGLNKAIGAVDVRKRSEPLDLTLQPASLLLFLHSNKVFLRGLPNRRTHDSLS